MNQILKLLLLNLFVAIFCLSAHSQSNEMCKESHEKYLNLERQAIEKAKPYYPNEPGFRAKLKVVSLMTKVISLKPKGISLFKKGSKKVCSENQSLLNAK